MKFILKSSLIIVIIFLTSCKNNDNVSKILSSSNYNNTKIESKNNLESQINETIDAALLRTFQNNIDTVMFYYDLYLSPKYDSKLAFDNQYPINLKYEKYEDFKCFIESTYVKVESDRLLNQKVTGSNYPRYHNVNGMLFINMDSPTTLTFYTEWDNYVKDNYKFSYNEVDNNLVNVTAYIPHFDPGVEGFEPINEPIQVHTQLIKEDGIWKLKNIIDTIA